MINGSEFVILTAKNDRRLLSHSCRKKSMNSTTPIIDATLPTEELEKINAYWSACNYLAAGMIFLCALPEKHRLHQCHRL